MGEPRPASSDYLFVLHLLDEGYGGLEHDDSTVLVYGRRNLETSSGYRKLLQLVAHEYFHQWNVRRLTPRELRPVDYNRASVIPTLWFAEGVTSYFDQLLPLTAGLSTPQDYFSDLGEDLSRYLLTPGRQVQTLRESSEEAWVKLYKADAYSASSQVSYYLKGAVVALCLDLELRRHQSTLSAVVQQLWRSHGRHGRGYGESDLLEAFEGQVTGLAGRLEQWLTDVDDPDCSGYLLDVGLALEPEMSSDPWTGMTTGLKDGRLVVQRVLRHSPAERAGLMVGDELIGLAGQRLAKPEDVPTHLRAGVAQPLLMARRSSLRELQLCSDPPQPKRYKLEPVANPTTAQQAAQEAWLQQRVG
jgi:predicted metalloprotease with PDZ domain